MTHISLIYTILTHTPGNPIVVCLFIYIFIDLIVSFEMSENNYYSENAFFHMFNENLPCKSYYLYVTTLVTLDNTTTLKSTKTRKKLSCFP